MDFWDVTKLMWRRWWVTLPLLLITAAATVYTARTVTPDHQATGRISMLPPTVRRDDIPGQVRRINPWTEEALAAAAAFRLQNKRFVDQAHAEGLAGTWNATTEGRLAVITIEVVAPTGEQAQATTRRLLDEVEDEIARRQQNLGLVEGETITSVVFDGGENVEVQSSKIKRALVTILGAGLVLTVGIVVGLDALLRRRARRIAAKAQSGTVGDGSRTSATAPPAGRTGGRDLEPAISGPSPGDATIALSLSGIQRAGEESASGTHGAALR